MPLDDQADFIRELGLPYFAHLLRRLSDEFVRGFDAWNSDAGLLSPTRTRSTLMALKRHEGLGVTEVATLIRQSHPLVITWIRQLKELGLVSSVADPNDGRRTVLRLTDAGEQEVQRLQRSDEISRAAYLGLLADAGVDEEMFNALWRIEEVCRRRAFEDRLRNCATASSGLAADVSLFRSDSREIPTRRRR